MYCKGIISTTLEKEYCINISIDISENFNITKMVQEINNGNYEIRLLGSYTHI